MTFEVSGCDILGFGTKAKEANDRGKHLVLRVSEINDDWLDSSKSLSFGESCLSPVGHGKLAAQERLDVLVESRGPLASLSENLRPAGMLPSARSQNRT
jgi:hypothetical protein